MEVSFKELMEAIRTTEYVPESLCKQSALGLRPGYSVVIRTVTYHYAGRVKSVDEGRVLLKDASWIADSGRWSEFLKTGEANEVEMYTNPVSVSLASIVDWTNIDVFPSSTK